MLEKLSHFIINHWVICTAFVILVVLLLLEEAKSQKGGDRLSPQDAVNLMNHEKGVVVDLRDQDAFKKGHIVGAIHVPHKDLETQIEKLKKYKEKPIILLDAMGQHSILDVTKLKKLGFTKVYAIAGGVTNWIKEGMPLVISH